MRKRIGENLKRQLKGIIKTEANAINAIALLVLGIILMVAGAFTRLAFFGLVGGGCLVLSLDKYVNIKNKGKIQNTLPDQEHSDKE